MTDRDLLEAAAKAAGFTRWFWECGSLIVGEITAEDVWNPLSDDGDALRLEVKLRITVTWSGSYVLSGFERTAPRAARLIQEDIATHKGDEMAATRRAIVRTAAAIGAAQQEPKA
jgi:hypothetical protein